MSIDTQIIESRIDDEEEGKKIREAELKRDIDLGNVYEAMKKTEGWKMLEKAILDRSSSLSKLERRLYVHRRTDYRKSD